MTTKQERAEIRKVLLQSYYESFQKKSEDWAKLGWDENHPQVVTETYELYSKVQTELKKLDFADHKEDNPTQLPFRIPEYRSIDKMTKEKVETIESLKAELAAAQAKLDEQAQEKVGWLIITPNLAYCGMMYDKQIKFTDGVCFIPKNKEVPYFKIEPLSEGSGQCILRSNWQRLTKA